MYSYASTALSLSYVFPRLGLSERMSDQAVKTITVRLQRINTMRIFLLTYHFSPSSRKRSGGIFLIIHFDTGMGMQSAHIKIIQVHST